MVQTPFFYLWWSWFLLPIKTKDILGKRLPSDDPPTLEAIRSSAIWSLALRCATVARGELCNSGQRGLDQRSKFAFSALSCFKYSISFPWAFRICLPVLRIMASVWIGEENGGLSTGQSNLIGSSKLSFQIGWVMTSFPLPLSDWFILWSSRAKWGYIIQKPEGECGFSFMAEVHRWEADDLP